MPRFRFSDAEIRDLVAYLRNDLAAEPPGSASNDQPDPALAGEGRALFERRGCGSCHGLTDGPPVARIGPKLTAIGDRVLEPAPLLLRDLEPTLPNWLGLKVREPDAVLDGARMPTFGFDAREAAELAVALSSLRARTMPETRTTKDPPLSFAEPQGEFGSLVRRYRCLSCHTLAGAGGTLSTVALDRIGSQLRREYLEGFLVEPVAVRVGLAERMPKLGLTAGEAKTLAAHMSAVLVDDTLAGDLPADAATLARGKLLLDRLGCIGCHMVGEGGGYVGPELNGSGLRLLPRWTAEFLRDPERWKPGTLQPSYGLSGEEAEALAAYTLSLPARKGRRTP
jgi:mono/diheme cytochrome c family protein